MATRSGVKSVAAGVAAAVTCLVSSGCGPASLLYLLFLMPRPTIPAAFDRLEDKTVVVVPYAGGGAQFEYAAIDSDLARRVVRQLRDNVDDIKLADPNQVAVWCDSHADYDLATLGREFKADYVLLLEIDRFSLFEPNSVQLYRGQAKVHVQVADVKQDGDVVWETYLESAFPGSRPVPATEMSREKFRQVYLERLSREVARNFFRYRPEETFTIE
jgi:hypothetical protein